MRLLDLFSGLKGWSTPFKERGHDVDTLDIDPRFESTYTCDIRDFEPTKDYDLILASPPCESFSTLSMGIHWFHDGAPKTGDAVNSLSIVKHMLRIIEEINPRYYIIENPRAMMRKLPEMQKLERHTVTMCQYGLNRMKPTDLFGVFPPSLELKPPCRNGDSCHIPAPRGSKSGTQILSPIESSKIPYELGLAVCLAAEKDLV